MGEEEDPLGETGQSVNALQWSRRPVLKALGVGGGLSAFAGTAAGDDDDGGRDDDKGGGEGDCEQEECIHPVLGYSNLGEYGDDGGELPDHLEPDHTVTATQRPPQYEETSELPLEFFFTPVGLHVEPGDIVEFQIESGEHTVTAYHEARTRQRRMPEDVPPFSSPMLGPGMSWLYRFDKPGVYDVFCAPHEHFGMVMRLVVGDETETNFGETGDGQRPPFGPFEFAQVIYNSEAEETPILDVDDTDELDPAFIVERGSVGWNALFV